MKRFNVLGMGLLIFCIGIQANASTTVYEGFDYGVGESLTGQSGGDGWDAAWAGIGDNPAMIADGLEFEALTVIGGAAQRPTRSGLAAISRTISSDSQTALLADDSTMWFSVVMKTFAGSTGDGATDGYALNSWGTLVLGDVALTGASGIAAAPIASGGNAIGAGFAGSGGGPDFANIRLQGVVYTNGVAIQNAAERITVGSNTVMVVGKVDWAADGSDDTVTLYNVTDPDAALPAAFSTMTVDLAQSTFNVVSIGDAQTSVFDEIRFGKSASDVGVGPPETLEEAILSIEYAVDAVTVGATNLTSGATSYLQFTEDLTDENSWSNLYSVSGVTETSWTISVSNSPVFYRIESAFE